MALASDTVSVEVWDKYTQERIRHWNYVRPASFHYPGDAIITGFTNMPQVIGAPG